MPRQGPKRVTRLSQKAQEASRFLPTPAPSAKRRRTTNRNDPDDLELYTPSQMPAASQVPVQCSSPPSSRSGSPPPAQQPQESLFITSSPPASPPPTQQVPDSADHEDEEEVTEQEQEQEQEEEEDPKDLLRYRLQVALKGSTGRNPTALQLNQTHEWRNRSYYSHLALYAAVMNWCTPLLGSVWTITNKQVEVDYRRASARDKRSTDVQNMIDWEDLREVALELQKDNREDIRIYMTIQCEGVVVVAPAASPTPVVAPASPIVEAVPASQPPRRGRQSATTEQRDQVPGLLEEEAARQDYSTRLRIDWVCKDRSCDNYGSYCWYAVEGNPMRNHWPLTAPVLTSWSKAIRDGSCTAEEPNIATLLIMKTAQEAKEYRSAERRRRGEAAGVAAGVAATLPTLQQQWQHPAAAAANGSSGVYVAPQVFFGADFMPHMPQLPRAHKDRYSPQITSSQAGDFTVSDFFEWCKQQRCWQGREQDLDRLATVCCHEDFELRDIAALDKDWWREKGLKEGHRPILKRSIDKFIHKD